MTLRPEGVYIRYVDEKGRCRAMVRIPDLYPMAEVAEPISQGIGVSFREWGKSIRAFGTTLKEMMGD